ncbi:MAG: TetR/AcrR family transcriptional regulator [Myxococcota bacterium]
MSAENTRELGKNRNERRRASTRARIVDAAERLMRERGGDGVTIQDITDAADVGHGTFYLHFKTKAEALRPVIERLSERVHTQVDRAARGAQDPALRMALGLRILLRAISEDPLWSWYARSRTPFRRLIADLGAPPLEDVKRGIQTGRFDVPDVPATWSFVDGALVGVITALSEGRCAGDVAETTAELVLRVLGIPAEEAAQIAREPLETH